MSGTRLAVFDFDGTLIQGDSIAAYLRFALKERALSPARLGWAALAFCAWKAGLITAAQAKTAALSFLRKLSGARKEALDEAFAQALAARIRPKAAAEMEKRRSEGCLIVLLSASTENYMAPLAALLGADKLICSRLDGQGRVTVNVRGTEKKVQLEKWLEEQRIGADLPASFSYGDSASDLPVLGMTGHPFLVSPGKKALRAAKGKIPVLDWR